MYTELEKDQRYVFAAPCFNRAGGDPEQVIGVIVIFIDAVPTQEDVPRYLFDVAGRVWSYFFYCRNHGDSLRLLLLTWIGKTVRSINSTTDRWSEGDFSHYIDDAAGDEISQFAQRLNNMARQLQSLLRSRQDMAVSEARSGLARELHDWSLNYFTALPYTLKQQRNY